MARRSITADAEEETEINLSPMIDCIFILLIFFIVTTVFVEETGFEVNKPQATASAATDEENENVTIEISADDSIIVNGTAAKISQVSSLVKRGLTDSETKVIIKPNDKASHGTFVDVYDAAITGGADPNNITFS